MITVYGISNCDTVRRARKWLEGRGIDYTFHDFRKDGIDAAQISEWVDELGWETILNRRGTTWRKLAEGDKQDLDASKAVRLMTASPAMIKRPVFDLGDRRLIGFTSLVQEQLEAL